MDTIYAEVGAQIRARRVQLELSLEDVAELSGMHPAYIGQIERGIKKCSLRSLERLAKALGVSTGRFFPPVPAGGAASFGQKLEAAARGASERDRRVILEVTRSLAKALRGRRA